MSIKTGLFGINPQNSNSSLGGSVGSGGLFGSGINKNGQPGNGMINNSLSQQNQQQQGGGLFGGSKESLQKNLSFMGSSNMFSSPSRNILSNFMNIQNNNSQKMQTEVPDHIRAEQQGNITQSNFVETNQQRTVVTGQGLFASSPMVMSQPPQPPQQHQQPLPQPMAGLFFNPPQPLPPNSTNKPVAGLFGAGISNQNNSLLSQPSGPSMPKGPFTSVSTNQPQSTQQPTQISSTTYQQKPKGGLFSAPIQNQAETPGIMKGSGGGLFGSSILPQSMKSERLQPTQSANSFLNREFQELFDGITYDVYQKILKEKADQIVSAYKL